MTPEVDPSDDSRAARMRAIVGAVANGLTQARSLAVNLFATLTVGAIVFILYRTVINSEVTVSPISAPKDLEEQGYSSEVTAIQLQNDLLDIFSQARSQKRGVSIDTHMDSLDIVVPNTGLPI